MFSKHKKVIKNITELKLQLSSTSTQDPLLERSGPVVIELQIVCDVKLVARLLTSDVQFCACNMAICCVYSHVYMTDGGTNIVLNMQMLIV